MCKLFFVYISNLPTERQLHRITLIKQTLTDELLLITEWHFYELPSLLKNLLKI